LNEKGTVISRPSNSGIATCMAASIGVSAADEAAHCSRELVRHSPCRTGTPRVASAPASQSPSAAPAAFDPPAARTVVMTASAWPSRPISSGSGCRSEAQNTGKGLPP
jgi:hypothetical protein